MPGFCSRVSLDAFELSARGWCRPRSGAWHHIRVADNIMRSEVLGRICREIAQRVAAGNPVLQGWDPAAPWAVCFLAVAADELRRPAPNKKKQKREALKLKRKVAASELAWHRSGGGRLF